MRNKGQAVEVPACQSERNEAFTRAALAGESAAGDVDGGEALP